MGLLAGDEHASRFREDLEFGSEDEDEGKDEDGEEWQSEAAQAVRGDAEMKAPLTMEDKKAMALLIVLCAFAVFTGIHQYSSPLIFRMDALFVRRHLHFVRYNPRRSCESFCTVHSRGTRTRRHDNVLIYVFSARSSNGCAHSFNPTVVSCRVQIN
jgi:hypothetical protein